MHRDEFVRALEFAARDGAASAILRQLASVTSGAKQDGLSDLAAWYRSLGDRERAFIAELAYRTADMAAFRMLCVLDGADAVTPDAGLGSFELELRSAHGNVALAGREQGVGLHELMNATSSTTVKGRPVRSLPIPELPADGSSRFLPLVGDEFRDVLLSYYRAKPELREIFPDPDSIAFWRWANVEAFAAYGEFRKYLPPVPPPELRDVVSSGGLVGFLDAGFASYMALARVLAEHKTSFEASERILDFGCGCGRLLRLLRPLEARTELHGCDVDEQAIAWCRRDLDWVATQVSATVPPLTYADGSFDLVYSISVFSHLEERNHLLWIEELARVANPRGLVVVTTHGPAALSQLIADPRKCADVGLTSEQVHQAERDLQRDGYAFCSQEQLAQQTDLYGMTFVTRDYIERSWCAHFEILSHESQGLQGWQDIVVLRSRRKP